jgi:hypothetical protein
MTSATPTMPLGDIASAGLGSPAAGPSIGSLMGAPPDQAQPSPTAQDRAKSELETVKDQIDSLKDMAAQIARQYPAFSEASRAIAEACTAGRVKLVANQLRGLEGPPPPNAAV